MPRVLKSDLSEFLNLREVCALVGLSRQTIWAACKSGDFPRPIRIRRRPFWPADRIAAFAAGQPASGAQRAVK